MDASDRSEPPLDADEPTMLRGWLDYHRDTLRWKADGLSRAQLDQPLAPSTMTLGGLVKHLALVESHWFRHVLLGEDYPPPFDDVDWEADVDWDWHSAAGDTPEQLLGYLDDAVAGADRAIDAALSKPTGLDTPSVRTTRKGDQHFTLRWILTHMIEEYARHNGHADLIREAIDGSTGD